MNLSSQQEHSTDGGEFSRLEAEQIDSTCKRAAVEAYSMFPRGEFIVENRRDLSPKQIEDAEPRASPNWKSKRQDGRRIEWIWRVLMESERGRNLRRALIYVRCRGFFGSFLDPLDN